MIHTFIHSAEVHSLSLAMTSETVYHQRTPQPPRPHLITDNGLE